MLTVFKVLKYIYHVQNKNFPLSKSSYIAQWRSNVCINKGANSWLRWNTDWLCHSLSPFVQLAAIAINVSFVKIVTFNDVSVAQWLECRSYNLKVAGSKSWHRNFFSLMMLDRHATSKASIDSAASQTSTNVSVDSHIESQVSAQHKHRLGSLSVDTIEALFSVIKTIQLGPYKLQAHLSY